MQIQRIASYCFHKQKYRALQQSAKHGIYITGADNVTWTHTVLLPLEPESSASADSAISANR